MDTFESILKRRSVREYTGEPIPKEDLQKIIDAARLAPSGNNQQTWHFVVVTDKDIIQRLSKAGDWMVKASAVIVVAMDPSTKYWVEDGSAAIENILLAATALGYGSCWVQGNAKPHEAEFKLLLNIPEHLNLLTLIPVGVPAEWPSQPDKKALDAILHWETFK